MTAAANRKTKGKDSLVLDGMETITRFLGLL